MQNNFTARPATEADRAYVVSIIIKRWQLTEEEANAEFERWLLHDRFSICYVGFYSGRPIATGVFDTVREPESFDISPYNTLLWVEPEYRRQGFGEKMSRLRYNWALSKGYKAIYLDTKDAVQYHLNRGWKEVRKLEHQGENFTIMVRILDDKLDFDQTRNIYEYSDILKPLAKDFGTIFYQTMLVWCKVIPSDNAQGDLLWEVWRIKHGKYKTVGVCGLYTLTGATDTSELWLGWFGLVPELRNCGLGKDAMQHLYEQAKKFGAKRILSYVDKDGAPLNFYKREGFGVIGTVAEYCQQRGLTNIDGEDFENGDDIVISKELLE